jgi:putative nucleotidyltransferase with HDIG domain
MIVDDEPANLRLLERLFRRDYEVITAASGSEALQLLSQHNVALLITDQRMPGMTGIELLKQTVAFRPHMVRIILTGYTDMTALVEAINCGHVYKYVTKPWSNDDLRLTVERALEHYETNRSRNELEQTNMRLSVRLQQMTRGVVRTIADALDARDEHLYGHARRVSGYATAIGRRLNLSFEALEQLTLAGLLHDIGKIGTPDNILLKPASLTDEEHAIVELHSERGARMLAGVPEMEEIVSAVRHHHEHFDGSGYPERLIGEQIPLASRIILVADAYDAMTSPRPFREAFDHDSAIDTLNLFAGTQFDPEVVRAFCGLEALGPIHHAIAQGAYGARLTAPTPSKDLIAMPFPALISEVEREPVLAISVLKQANKIKPNSTTANIQLACEIVGDTALRTIIRDFVSGDWASEGNQLLFEHSLGSAIAAKLLAEKTGLVNPADAYTLGLLHDSGEALLCWLFPDEMTIIRNLKGEPRTDREVSVFGVDHAQVSQWILESCGIPRNLTTAVQTHHDPLRTNASIASLLELANSFANAKTPQQVVTLDPLGSDSLMRLGVTREDLAIIHAQVIETLRDILVAAEVTAENSWWTVK